MVENRFLWLSCDALGAPPTELPNYEGWHIISCNTFFHFHSRKVPTFLNWTWKNFWQIKTEVWHLDSLLLGQEVGGAVLTHYLPTEQAHRCLTYYLVNFPLTGIRLQILTEQRFLNGLPSIWWTGSSLLNLFIMLCLDWHKCWSSGRD